MRLFGGRMAIALSICTQTKPARKVAEGNLPSRSSFKQFGSRLAGRNVRRIEIEVQFVSRTGNQFERPLLADR